MEALNIKMFKAVKKRGVHTNNEAEFCSLDVIDESARNDIKNVHFLPNII